MKEEKAKKSRNESERMVEKNKSDEIVMVNRANTKS